MTNPNEPINAAMDNNNYQGVDRMELRYEGLTKREHMAIEFTKAILSTGTALKPGTSNETICLTALSIADELIKQLNNEN